MIRAMRTGVVMAMAVIAAMATSCLARVEQFGIDCFDPYFGTGRQRLVKGSFHQSALTSDRDQEVVIADRKLPMLVAHVVAQFERLVPPQFGYRNDEDLPSLELDNDHAIIVFEEHVPRREFLIPENDAEFGPIREFGLESRTVSFALAYNYCFEGASLFVRLVLLD